MGFHLFQLTASQGGWHNGLIQDNELLTFQLTASQGGWQFVYCDSYREVVFQLTASQGGWQYDFSLWNISQIFQLTASQGGWQVSPSGEIHPNSFQLTASQGGWRDLPEVRLLTTDFNSQPHKEADQVFLYKKRWGEISTHSLTRRLTRYPEGFDPDKAKFQLTASQGGWQLQRWSFHGVGYFNSQPHKEADRLILSFHSCSLISTHSLTRRLT